jgi:hypothetical protein
MGVGAAARRFRCVTSANFVSSCRGGGARFPVSKRTGQPRRYCPSAMLLTLPCEICRNEGGAETPARFASLRYRGASCYQFPNEIAADSAGDFNDREKVNAAAVRWRDLIIGNSRQLNLCTCERKAKRRRRFSSSFVTRVSCFAELSGQP